MIGRPSQIPPGQSDFPESISAEESAFEFQRGRPSSGEAKLSRRSPLSLSPYGREEEEEERPTENLHNLIPPLPPFPLTARIMNRIPRQYLAQGLFCWQSHPGWPLSPLQLRNKWGTVNFRVGWRVGGHSQAGCKMCVCPYTWPARQETCEGAKGRGGHRPLKRQRDPY